MARGRTVVGFVGLGAIGSPMAERLVQGGEDVVVYNRTVGKTARFRGRARIAISPAEMADYWVDLVDRFADARRNAARVHRGAHQQ